MYQDAVSTGSVDAQLDDEWASCEAAEAGRVPFRLHLWESPRATVVLGRSAVPAEHVHEYLCRGDGVPSVRRASGGALFWPQGA